tara:strand:- start:52597 stop:52719 length:123 start_codon:yes stop_codon:yes gene_type:complete
MLLTIFRANVLGSTRKKIYDLDKALFDKAFQPITALFCLA